MKKILRWAVRIPFICVFLLGVPLVWLIAFAFEDDEGEANEYMIDLIKELFR